jgi:phosphohistidine phosphatase
VIELYILRHAPAESRQLWGPRRERDRPLTRKGEMKMWPIAKRMKRLKLSFDLILSSPFLRARRTAEIVADTFGMKIQLADALLPTADPKSLFRSTTDLFRAKRKIVIVGHDPFLGRLISFCLCGKASIQVTLKKGGLCKLASPSSRLGTFSLEWMLTPAQLVNVR